MTYPETTRAMQRLLVQGFTLYTAEAALAMRAVASTTFADASTAWAVLVGPDDARRAEGWGIWGIAEDEPLRDIPAAMQACQRSGAPVVLCCLGGTSTFLDLLDPDVGRVRERMEAEAELEKKPTQDSLEAFSDVALQRELERRKGLPSP